MASGFQQYLKDTQSELHHVAWPTRAQTIVYTGLVVLISIGVSVYLSLFDFAFTSGLKQAVFLSPNAAPAVSVEVATGTATSTSAPTQGAKTNGSSVKLPTLGDKQSN